MGKGGVPIPPASGTFGSTHTFTVKIDIANNEILPIESVDLYIYKSDDEATYKAACANLPLATTAQTSWPVTAGTSETCGTVSITASTTNWEWFHGTLYAYWSPTGYNWGTGYGYGYSGTGTASITYTG